MGNICSRSANKPDDPFARPGRPLGSSNTNSGNNTAPVPKNKGKPFSSPGRTLGGDTGQSGSDGDVKAKAAVAAQKRAESQNNGKGKLGTKLAAQKAQTQNQTLEEVSRDERAARDADGTAETRRWN